jgi:hypothetical protein
MGERRLSLAADDRVVLLGHFSNEGKAFAAWTHNRGMVNLAKDYITHDIISLKLVKQFEPQIEAIFGRDHVAEIKDERKEKYPLKGDLRRRALER